MNYQSSGMGSSYPNSGMGSSYPSSGMSALYQNSGGVYYGNTKIDNNYLFTPLANTSPTSSLY